MIEILPTVPTTGGAWTGRGPLATPPAIGAHVHVRMNDLGPGVVLGYWLRAGYIGVAVKLDNPPDWLVRQERAAGREVVPPAFVFGSELAGYVASPLVEDLEAEMARDVLGWTDVVDARGYCGNWLGVPPGGESRDLQPVPRIGEGRPGGAA